MSNKDIIILGCSSQQPTRKRNHGAYLVRWNEEGFLFDPGEGTQRQFIFANIAPPVVNRIFISHFHGDHCLGVGSMLMRLNLDKVTHPIHCYYPASGKKYFDRLRYGCIYHENIEVIEHPVSAEGIVDETPNFIIEASFLEHGVHNIGWRIREKDRVKFDREKLRKKKIFGPNVKKIQSEGFLDIENERVLLEEVSWIRAGEIFAYVIDTRPCNGAMEIAKKATVLLCESTFLEEQKDLAYKYFHMTAKQAGELARAADVKMLILTHFSARYQNLEFFEQEARSVFKNSYVADDLKRFEFPK